MLCLINYNLTWNGFLLLRTIKLVRTDLESPWRGLLRLTNQTIIHNPMYKSTSLTIMHS